MASNDGLSEMLKMPPTNFVSDDVRTWAIVNRAGLCKKLRFIWLIVRHVLALMPLLQAPRASNLRRLIRARPEIVWIVLTSYMAQSWNCRTRVARLVDHCKTVAEIGGVVDFPPNISVDVIKLAAIDLRYRITLDQARWLLREGPLVFSLWDGAERIFCLMFCLSSENGRRVAYVGAIQGRREIDINPTDILNCYRHFTKAASGMRPRDFLIEAFKIFCRALSVNEIRAVAKLNHSFLEDLTEFKLPYDDIWIERGGIQVDDGFFVLSVAASRRSHTKIPAKKRAMYAKRYSMLDAIEAELSSTLLRTRIADPATNASASRPHDGNSLPG